VINRGRFHWGCAKPCRLRCRIRVERRLRETTVARPPAHARDLVRIRLARNDIRIGFHGRRPSRKTRHREIETSPEEMHGTAFPDESRTELREDLRRQRDDAPEALDGLAVVRAVMLVAIEG